MPSKAHKISTHILLLISVGIGLLVLAAGYAAVQMEWTKRGLARIAEDSIPVSRSLTRLNSFQLQRAVLFERALQLEHAPSERADPARIRQLHTEFDDLSELIARDIERTQGIIDPLVRGSTRRRVSAALTDTFGDVQQGLNSLERHHDAYSTLAHRVFVLLEQGNAERVAELRGTVQQEQLLLKKRVTALLFELENLVQRSTMHTHSNLDAAQTMLIAIAAFGLVFSILFGMFLKRRITDSLGVAVNIAERIASGERDIEVGGTTLRETADLLEAMATMSGSISRVEGRLRESETRVRAVLDTVADGIITIDRFGTIESFNPAAERIFGYAADEVIGENVKMLMPEPYRREHDGYLERYRRTGERHVIGAGTEVTGLRRSGATFPMELAVTEMKVSGEQCFVGMVRDITERKKVERMKNEFVSTVSHELRTPLTSIRGSLGLIIGGAAGELPEKAVSLLTIACNNSERLVRLINDILDIEKIESGKMEFDIKEQELMPLVRQSIEANRSYGQQYGVIFELCACVDDAHVVADADRITQVVDNLLSNAAKFSPKGGTVDIEVRRLDGRVRVSVTDHGSGIPEEFRSQVFQKFAQADCSDTRQKGGTGLGLSICQAIIEAHQGEIGFETETGVGTTFYFELPEKRHARNARAANDSAAKSARILVCEDDPDVARLLSMMLQGTHYEIDVAYDAEQAKRLLDQHEYAAMTVDLMLPGQDGISMIRELRADERTKDLPIVVVSAKAAQSSEQVEGSAFGITDWLAKPIDQEQLLRAVQHATDQDGPLRVLHVEDDPDVTEVVSAILHEDAEITRATSLREATERLEAQRFDLVIIDIGLPDGSGLDLLPVVNRAAPGAAVAVFSAHEIDKETAHRVDAALVKARTSNEELLDTIRRLVR